MANIWQGPFPVRNRADDGYVTTAPVKTYPPNGYGLYDTAGNVWEWCSDWYAEDTFEKRSSVLTRNPQGPEKSHDPDAPYAPKRVVRGGSHLCTDSYCTAYRTTGRMPSDPLTGLSHTGFRCVKSVSRRLHEDTWAKTDYFLSLPLRSIRTKIREMSSIGLPRGRLNPQTECSPWATEVWIGSAKRSTRVNG